MILALDTKVTQITERLFDGLDWQVTRWRLGSS